VTEHREKRLQDHRHEQQDDLEPRGGMDAGLAEQRQSGENDQGEPGSLKADAGHPVEQGEAPTAVLAVGCPADCEGGGPGLRSLKAREADTDEDEVAEKDDEDRLGEREAEIDHEGAVHRVEDVEIRSHPHPEQIDRFAVPRLGPDEIDAPLLDHEQLVSELRP
jgi:hypothetical protein